MTLRPPETQYARGSGVNIAYQLFGEGPRDLVLQMPYLSHLEHNWELPDLARLYRRLAKLGRTVVFNQRGTGLSDPVLEPPALEERVADMHAVLDAVGVEQAVICTMSEGGPVAAQFAASHSERVEALVFYGSFANRANVPTGAAALEEADADANLEQLVETMEPIWGTGLVGMVSAPSMAGDEAHRKWLAKLERMCASPRSLLQLGLAAVRADVRGMLSEIRAPTLVLHRTGDPLNPIAEGRELADGIPGARFVELEGSDHALYVNADQILDCVEEWLTGSKSGIDPDLFDGAVLFTDIVDSTGRIAELGDRRWHRLLDAHDRALRAEFERLDAAEVRSTGDGFMTLFDDVSIAVAAGLRAIDEASGVGLEIRAGIHAGELRLMGGSAGGMVVHTAARVCEAAGPTELLVTSAVTERLDSEASSREVAERGEHALKGVPRPEALYVISGSAPDAPGSEQDRAAL